MSEKEAQAILEAMQIIQEARGGAKKTKKRAQDWTETQEEPLVPSKKRKSNPPIVQDSQVAGIARGGRGRARGQGRGRGSAARGRGASASQVCPTCGHNCDQARQRDRDSVTGIGGLVYGDPIPNF